MPVSNARLDSGSFNLALTLGSDGHQNDAVMAFDAGQPVAGILRGDVFVGANELNQRVLRVAQSLHSLGVGAGDRVDRDLDLPAIIGERDRVNNSC